MGISQSRGTLLCPRWRRLKPLIERDPPPSLGTPPHIAVGPAGRFPSRPSRSPACGSPKIASRLARLSVPSVSCRMIGGGLALWLGSFRNCIFLCQAQVWSEEMLSNFVRAPRPRSAPTILCGGSMNLCEAAKLAVVDPQMLANRFWCRVPKYPRTKHAPRLLSVVPIAGRSHGGDGRALPSR